MMNKSNSIELIDRASLAEETKFQLDVISKKAKKIMQQKTKQICSYF